MRLFKKEIWKDIEGFEGYYQISNLGSRVKSLKRKSVTKNKILKLAIYGEYYGVYLFKNGKRKHCFVHKLKAIAFIPNPENKPVVNHKDNDKLNNKINNLEWATYSEDKLHAWQIRFKTNKYMKINREKLLQIKEEFGMTYRSFAEHISDKIGKSISTNAIWSLCTLDHNATIDTIQKVAEFLNIPISELLNEESKKEYKLETNKEW